MKEIEKYRYMMKIWDILNIWVQEEHAGIEALWIVLSKFKEKETTA